MFFTRRAHNQSHLHEVIHEWKPRLAGEFAHADPEIFPLIVSLSNHKFQFSDVLNEAQPLNGMNARYSGMQAVTVISTRSSGKFNITSTVVLAGLLVGKNLAYSSL